MAFNPYWNTMWNERDEEFYWSGVKHGAVISAIATAIIIFVPRELVREFKEEWKKPKTES